MKKYYNKEIPTEIHVVYGGRRSGKTYYELKKLKEEYNKLKENNFELFKSYERLVNRIGKAIEYINNTDLGTLDKWKLQEILKGGKK